MPDQITRVTVNGRRFWRFNDGTLLPVVSGGDGGGEGGTGDGGSGNSGGTEGGDGDKLGDGGKKALDAERADRKAAEKAAKAEKKRADELEARLKKLEEGSKSEQEKKLEQARKTAEENARKEERARSDRRILVAEIKAAAGTKLADPNDAVRLLDLDEFEVDDDGEVDAKAISKAIDDLLKDKPYLAADGKGPTGDADQGARGGDGKKTEVAPGMGRLRAAYASSNQ